MAANQSPVKMKKGSPESSNQRPKFSEPSEQPRANHGNLKRKVEEDLH